MTLNGAKRVVSLTPEQRRVVAVLAAVAELRDSRAWPSPPGPPRAVNHSRTEVEPARDGPGCYTVSTRAAISLSLAGIVEFPVVDVGGRATYGLPQLTSAGAEAAAALDADVAAVGLRVKKRGAGGVQGS